MDRPIHGGNLAWAASLAGCPASAIVDFSASINPLGPPNSAITAIEQGMKRLTAYPDPCYQTLRTSLAEWHQLAPEWILPGNGSAELLTWAARDLSCLAATYLLTPAFSDYRRALTAFAAKMQCESMLDETRLASILENGNSTAGLLLNNPHNPTGKLLTRESILPALKKFALVVVDEAFMDFLTPPEEQSVISLVQNYPNLVILRSLTKFYSLPGLRLGYAIAHPNRLKRWQQWRDPWSVNVLAAAAAAAVIKDREFQQMTWNWLPEARATLFKHLAAVPYLEPLPGAANFLLVHTQTSSTQLQEQLLKQERLLIRDCLSFPELGEAYFRVAVRTPEDNQRLCQALAAID
ncbi:MAG: threonine-phosphate decarboxylase CobD [Cyanophyceae cyanobacterium]